MILELEKAPLTEVRDRLSAEGSVVFVSGNFNVVHPGHLRLLKFASEVADFLVVGVLPDSSSGVTVPADMRVESLQANIHIDHVFIMESPVEDVISELRPDIVVKGKEFEHVANLEQAAVESYGGKLLFSSGEVQFSTLALLRQEYLESSLSNIDAPLDLPDRRGFKLKDLKGILEKFSQLRVLVIGDLIIDSYIDCEPLGMSQEEPTIVLSPIEERTFVGGAGIVSLHARGLGADVQYLTVVGDDDRARFAMGTFEQAGVKATQIVDKTRPTTLKTRYRAAGKSMLRVNTLRQHAIEQVLIDQVLSHVDRVLADVDLLLFSDFNYGCLPQQVVDAITLRAHENGVMTAADSQASSQLADISRYKGMTLITPTEREARLANQDFESGLISVAEQLKKRAGCQHLLVTLGAEGMLIYGEDHGTTTTDRLSAFNSAPRDVAGAGDSLFTTTSLALRTGADIWQSAYLGSLAAACQTSRVGNTPLSVSDIVNEIDMLNHRM